MANGFQFFLFFYFWQYFSNERRSAGVKTTGFFRALLLHAWLPQPECSKADGKNGIGHSPLFWQYAFKSSHLVLSPLDLICLQRLQKMIIQKTSIATVAVQLLLFVLFFYLFGLPLIQKYEEKQVSVTVTSGSAEMTYIGKCS